MIQRISTIAIVAAALLILAWMAWAFLPAPFEVDVASAERGALVVAVSEQGAVRARDRFVLMAPISARLSRPAFRLGDKVSVGQLLAHFETLSYSAAEREAHALRLRSLRQRAAQTELELARAQAQAEQAVRGEARLAELAASGLQPSGKHEEAKLAAAAALGEARAAAFAHEGALADVRFAEAAWKLSEDSGRLLELFSPVNGVVTELIERDERVVPSGAPLLAVSDPGRLEVVVPLRAADAVKVRPGMALEIENWGGDGSLRLAVREVDSAAQPRVSVDGGGEARVNVFADVANAPVPMGEGYRVATRVILEQKPQVVKVPLAAVFQSGQGSAVFVVEGHRARKAAVTTGLRNALEVEIVSGLEAGDLVIVNPPPGLDEGSRLAARKHAAITGPAVVLMPPPPWFKLAQNVRASLPHSPPH